ncbi:hypothetical protein [Chitinophaga rhizophila]|uniref:DUF1129 family protein n=1 Tax=Chitinophaga rhizophila TaxID=2866212 RepID=A0ABS7G849_9BACT|nr:hypothetical protein [Chitinophaga rhizophila]MBW8683631.1 hypothetical protein [Chitinophaga rhizophila]
MTPGITEQQFNKILDFLKANAVTNPGLLQQMAENLTIEIELRTKKGADFDTAFRDACHEWEQQKSLTINRKKERQYPYPSFMSASFLNKFLLFAVAILLAGIYMQMDHLLIRKIVILSGAGLIGYIYLPLLLLHSLDEVADKARQITGFLVQFVLLHAGIAYILDWRMHAFLAVLAFLTGIVWLMVYVIIPSLKTKEH